MNEQINKLTFTCWKCKRKSKYNPLEYTFESIILERRSTNLEQKTKEIVIKCSFPDCNADNLISIQYE
jgi:hypothetical protein